MSHIPSIAMKHAGPAHHDDIAPDPKAANAKAGAIAAAPGLGVATWLAIGGTLIAGAAAALAVPLLRARKAPIAIRRGKRATVRKAKRHATPGK